MLSTLAEDDRVGVSPFPGETTECQAFPVVIDGREVLRFVDTPGFQYPIATLEWFQAHASEMGNLAGLFRAAHLNSPEHRVECELLSALAEGAGVLYVVDGSRPVESEDRVEMEILRLAGNPRMALINSKEDSGEYLEEWEQTTRRYFNSIRVFNAHQAGFSERMGLLESLKSIDQRWEPALELAVRVFREDWERRTSRAAYELVVLMEKCAGYSEKARWRDGEDPEQRRRVAQEVFFRGIGKLEESWRERLKEIYRHRLFNYVPSADSILSEELTSEKTLRLLGLSRGQFAGLGAVSGGLAGGFVDAHAGGASLLAGTLIGAGVGGVFGYFSSVRLTEVKVANVELGWKEIVVRAPRFSNLPYILLDRALIYFAMATTWSHGRRDSPVRTELPKEPARVGHTGAWGKERRKVCQQFLDAVRRGNGRKLEEARKRLALMLEEVLREMS